MKKSIINTFFTIAVILIFSTGFSVILGGSAVYASSYSGNMKISGNMHMSGNTGYMNSSKKNSKKKKKGSGSSKAKSTLKKMGAGCL